jgi:hypothetical protein
MLQMVVRMRLFAACCATAFAQQQCDQEWGQSPLALALRGSNSDFTAIDSIKSGTVAQTEATVQRTVLVVSLYSIIVSKYGNFRRISKKL